MCHNPVSRRQHVLFVIILFVLSLSTVHGRLCKTPECQICGSSCPKFRKIHDEYIACGHYLLVARSKYVSEATLDCIHKPCIPTVLQNACYLIGNNNVPQNRKELLQVLDKRQQLAEKTAIRFTQRTKALIQSVENDRKLSEYVKKVNDRMFHVKKMFDNALRTRAHFHRQTDYVQTATYRRMQQEVKRLHFEVRDFGRQIAFWEALQKTVSDGVRSSPRTLLGVRDALRRERKAFEADAKLVKELKRTSMSKDERATLAVQLKDEVRLKVEELQSFNAHMMAEEQFLKEARMEIFNLFKGVLNSIRRRRHDVKCGDGALADAVSKTILASS